MRILYCLDGTFNSGGKERIITGKANRLAAKGYEVGIFTSEQGGRPDFYPLHGVERFDADVFFSSLKDKNPLVKYLHLKKRKREYLAKLKKRISEFQPDIVISTNGYEIGIVGKIAGIKKKIIETHFTRWFRLQRNRKGIWGLIDRIKTHMDLRYVRNYDLLICLTQEDRENWKEIRNTKVINNFIENRTEKPTSLEAKRMIAVGRLEYQKGFDRLISAWEIVNRRFPDWRLDIYGNGVLKDSLLSQINESGLSGIIEIHPPEKDIHKEYMASSALVMTSRYEGLPMVMLEAMEAGLPVVSFDFQCGPKDFIENGVNGFIVRNGDIQQLADRICELIQSEDLRKEMGERNFQKAKNNYPDPIIAEWIKIFDYLSD